MSKKIDELLYDSIATDITTWINIGVASSENKDWKRGFRAGLIRAKRILRDWLIDEEE